MTDIDPEMNAALSYMKDRTSVRPGTAPAGMADARRRASSDFAFWNEGGPDLYRVEDLQLPGAFGDRPVRHYQPEDSDEEVPALIHFHGGGWIVGDLDLEDRFLRELSLASGHDIFSVDYVLAPEHRFPDPVHDCIAISQAIHENATLLGIDDKRLGVSGSSAGANLAMAASLSMRDTGDLFYRNMLLFYGVFRASQDSASHRSFADGRFSPGGPGLDFFLQQYLPDASFHSHPLVSPLLADLHDLPATWLCIAELDELRDDSIDLARKLQEAGVSVESRLYPGVIHGFTLMSRMVSAARTAIEDAATWLRDQSGPGT